MRRVISLLAVAGCGRIGFDPSGAGDASIDAAPIQRVQIQQPMFVTGAQLTTMLDVTAGNVLVAIPYWNHSGSTVQVADSRANTWTALPRVSVPTGCNQNVGTNAQIFVAAMTTTGPMMVTATQTIATNPLGLFLVEYSGIDIDAPVENSAGNAAPAASNEMRTGTLTTQEPTVIVAGFHNSEGMGTMVAGPGLTTLSLDTMAYALFGEMAVPPGSYDVSATLPTGVSDRCWVAAAVALRATD